MNKIQIWKHKKQWSACIHFAEDKTISVYTASVFGVGKTKKKAVSNLCEALMTLSDDMCEVVHEVNING